jgi:sterol desaturase/sphingolipid hydroxylase (fatty acid hydroxylase superfamily)
MLSSEAAVRLGAFMAVFVTMALWEMAAPRRRPNYSRFTRWPSNLGIVALNRVLLRILLPGGAVSLAFIAEQWSSGLLNNLGLPVSIAIIGAVVLLDFAIYLQHVMFHAVPALWRLHRMHHADLDFDVTTGARFHPLEIVLSMLIKLAAVAVLGPPALGVLIFEVLLNATSMFNHGNVRLPSKLDLYLRWFVVTPDMHRVHHSVVVNETNSNFGFNLPWWDRLLGTYRDQPAAGHEGMTIGIEQFREARELRLDRMLLQPFRGEAGGYAIGREAEPLGKAGFQQSSVVDEGTQAGQGRGCTVERPEPSHIEHGGL